MKMPLHIRFQGLEASEAVESAAREKAAKLDQFCPDLMSCTVTVELLHKHRQQGRQFEVRIDVTNEGLPSILWHNTDYTFHGMNLNSTGTRLYGADLGNSGLTILDVSQIQKRVANPQVKLVSHITWPNVSIPQNTIPVTNKGHKYLV